MSWRSLYRHIRSAVGNELAYERRLKERSPHAMLSLTALPLRQKYLLSSNVGLLHVSSAGIRKISDFDCFGVCRDKDSIFIATTHGSDSVVLKGDATALDAQGSPLNWQEINRVPVTGHSGRIHQIAVHGPDLWICNTHQNLLTRVDKVTGAWKASIAPFSCAFDHPITSDHNHINSVAVGKDFVAFTAFRAGKKAAFGLIGRGMLKLFVAANMGCHDCVFDGQAFWYSDSFQMFEAGKNGGAVYRGGSVFAPEVFSARTGTFIRGISGDGDELLIGNSFTGARTERFQGQGSLLIFRGEELATEVAMPAAQIYDIMQLADGQHFPTSSRVENYDAALTLMNQAFGCPYSEQAIADFLVSPNGRKKFSDSDHGDIQSLL